jgi:hypothetical protein
MIALLHPYAEMPSGMAIRHALKWQLVGLLLLACHVLLVKQNIAFVVFVPILLGVLYSKAPLTGLLVYFQFLIFQNWMISLASPGMAPLNFTVLQGSNFLAIVLLAAIGACRLFAPPWRRETKAIMAVIIVAVAAAIFYAALGSLRAGPTSAAVYFREFIGPACGVVVGLDVGRAWGFRTIAIGLLTSVMLSIVIALVEIMVPIDYYASINATDFMNLKSNCCLDRRVFGPYGVADQNISALFNFTGDSPYSAVTSFRFMSTVMHPISYAYILAVAALLAISLRQYFWLLILVPLMVAIGVKGAAVLLVCSLCLWTVWISTRSGTFLVISTVVLLVTYMAYGLMHGMEYNDFHVIGFLGGWNGFLRNPFGHGIGVGGNLSSGATGLTWTGSGSLQAVGADFGLESAVGVLIYQMGVGSIAVFAVFIVLLKAAPFFRRGPQGRDIWLLALATVMANGVFQEEAFAPTAAGLIALLCAVVVINEQRQAVMLSKYPNLLAQPGYA